MAHDLEPTPSLLARIRRTAASQPEHVALVFGHDLLTYAGLVERVDAAAALLHHHGVRVGDVVGLFMPNGTTNVVAGLALRRLGAVEVNTSPDMRLETIVHAFTETRISALVVDEVPEAHVEHIVSSCSWLRLVVGGTSRARPAVEVELRPIRVALTEPAPPLALDDPTSVDDIAIVQYTSGSSGLAKGVCLSDRNFLVASERRAMLLGIAVRAPVLDLLPLSHSCSRSLLYDAFVAGSTLWLSAPVSVPSRLLAIIQAAQPAIVTGPPLIFRWLTMLTSVPKAIEALRTHLRYLEVGLSTAPRALLIDLQRAFPWVTLINRYGLTENAGAAELALVRPGDDAAALGALGRADALTGIEIRNATDDLDGSRTGEIVVKGDNVMVGYWSELSTGSNVHHRTTEFSTGDLARIDRSGWVHCIGRRDDVIKIAGQKVVPKDVEDVIATLGMSEIAVVSVDEGGPDPILVAVYYGGVVTTTAIMEVCRTRLPSYMVPGRIVEWHEPLPKTASGKIARRLIAERCRPEAPRAL